ncbi:serine/threonine-protein kinase [Tautonia plasticadhaerens]|uniref:Serine/threonine-protein kinase PknB n=1 Tax=Tautonia plasticadhaerens TaxID=2527974 RepID=A0A518H1Y6_9BACT|nr:serine/threonine-protein kinase [Tautonia plasticadhaerens]QDV34851.1 Serine/threonine-protein kinase PknB [Tautonia plasticadhaerens]
MDVPRSDDPTTPTDRMAETVDLDAAAGAFPLGDPTSASRSLSGGEGPASRGVEVVEGSVDLSEETRELLRIRLRAVAGILLIGFIAFFLRNQFLPQSQGIRLFFAIDSLHVLTILLLGGALLLLEQRRDWSMRRLRQMELVIFGSSLLFFVALHYSTVTHWIERGDFEVTRALLLDGPPDPGTVAALVEAAGRLIGSIEGSVVFIMILIILYGLFVPNTWRRAARAVGLLFLAAAAVQATVLVQTADSRAMVERLASFEQISTNVLILLLAALISVYGSHLINSLRVEAFEARRLGQYMLRGRIGGGGMGEVYLAEHQLLKRPCAIKLIRPDRAGDPVALRRFEREVRAMARLSHWNTIEVYDYGRTEDGTFYYVMEYLRGLALDALVARHGPLPPARAVYLLRQACDSLAEAHAAGLVHRDLKPANLFAAARGGRHDVVKVLDFGLVKGLGPEAGEPGVDRAESVSGTPLYMSPEQATADPRLGPRSDLYALGAVSYFLLTGRPPHPGDSPLKVMAAVARVPPEPPSRHRAGIPVDLERVVLRCLAKEPHDRFPSAEALGRALASCSCAPDWDASRAASWWVEFEPGALRGA